MNDRLPLLRAIDAAPDDETPRLVYADWLEENSTCGRDKGTLEFIRLGCRGPHKGRLSAAEGEWLQLNWRMLVPALAPHVRGKFKRCGRWVSLRADMPVRIVRPEAAAHLEKSSQEGFRFAVSSRSGRDLTWACYFRLEFWRGFVRRVVFPIAEEMELVLPALATDQPLCRPDVNFHMPHPSDRTTSLLRERDMGPAWYWVPGLQQPGNSPRPDIEQIAFQNDPVGLKAARVRQAAFRGYTISLAQKAGSL